MFTVKVIDSGIAYEFSARKSLIEPILVDASRYFKRLGFGSSAHWFEVVARELMNKVIGLGDGNCRMNKMNLNIKRINHQSLFEITVQAHAQDQKNAFAVNELESVLFSDHGQLKKCGYNFINEMAGNVKFEDEGSLISICINMSAN